MSFELVNCTNTLLDEIAHEEIRQPSVALTYALAMASSEPTDWPKVNAAIVERWSQSGLIRIKRMAHARMRRQP